MKHTLTDDSLITQRFGVLVETIRNYESDTFSSEESKITPEEAYEVAESFVSHYMQGLIDGHTMDGIMIDYKLQDIRLEAKRRNHSGVGVTWDDSKN